MHPLPLHSKQAPCHLALHFSQLWYYVPFPFRARTRRLSESHFRQSSPALRNKSSPSFASHSAQPGISSLQLVHSSVPETWNILAPHLVHFTYLPPVLPSSAFSPILTLRPYPGSSALTHSSQPGMSSEQLLHLFWSYVSTKLGHSHFPPGVAGASHPLSSLHSVHFLVDLFSVAISSSQRSHLSASHDKQWFRSSVQAWHLPTLFIMKPIAQAVHRF